MLKNLLTGAIVILALILTTSKLKLNRRLPQALRTVHLVQEAPVSLEQNSGKKLARYNLQLRLSPNQFALKAFEN